MGPAALIRTDTTRGNDMSEVARFLSGCAIIDGPSLEPYMRVPKNRRYKCVYDESINHNSRCTYIYINIERISNGDKTIE
jgi:hypothetical protein